MKAKNIILVAALSLFSTAGFSQESESSNSVPLIGIGINLTQFRMVDLWDDYYGAPANKLMITVSPLKYLRIEPEVGFFSHSYEDQVGNGQKFDLKDRLLTFGAGLFGMYQKGNTNMYGGLRFESASIKDEYLEQTGYDINWNPIYAVSESESSRTTFSPTIGAEYFLGEHFSIGGEFGIRIMSIKSEYPGSSTTDKSNMTSTDAALQMRIYF